MYTKETVKEAVEIIESTALGPDIDLLGCRILMHASWHLENDDIGDLWTEVNSLSDEISEVRNTADDALMDVRQLSDTVDQLERTENL